METMRIFNGFVLIKITDNSFSVNKNDGECVYFDNFFDAADYFIKAVK